MKGGAGLSEPPNDRSSGAPERLFYDGSCALCHGAVRFVLARDPDGSLFRFAPLDGDAFRRAAASAVPASLPDSLVMETREGRLLTRSAAVIHVLSRLRAPWRWLGAVARVFPRSLLDALYDLVARFRYRIFGREANACPVIPKRLRARFDL